jgi:SNF2 family DNA or RNA helicase
MKAQIRFSDEQLIVEDKVGELTGRHFSQLNFWGFRFDSATRTFIAEPKDLHVLLDKLLKYFSRCEISYELDEHTEASREIVRAFKDELEAAIEKGSVIKNGDVKTNRPEDFLRFLTEHVPRKLKDHQLKSALHLIAVGNAANFSVPGSGKTTVVLSVFGWLRRIGVVDSLFVIGPPSCFAPWQNEFREVLGAEPTVALLAGGNIGERLGRYSASKNTRCDLYLTSYQTLQRDSERAKRLLSEKGIKFFFVVDEAHYIKQLGGAWASAVLSVCPFAVKRCVLTGTPFPRTYSDAFNLFDALWPTVSPLAPEDRTRLDVLAQKNRTEEAGEILKQKIGPLFYRVRKSDLGLAPQIFHEPLLVQMGKHEKFIYDSILDRLKAVSKSDFFRDLDLLIKLRRGRMMRLRQCVSYPKLLANAVQGYRENLAEGNPALADKIVHYDELETPGKLLALIELVAGLNQRGQKVLVWSNFVEALKLIRARLEREGHGVRLIFGETPTEREGDQEELSREAIIREFLETDSAVNVLVANPAACAESISLHKSCSHAIYYDLSYNGAQYLQSLDRIHRVGGSENKEAHYYFLHYADSIDGDILANVRRKSENMAKIVDHEFPIYSLDMFSVDDELEAYERLFT